MKKAPIFANPIFLPFDVAFFCLKKEKAENIFCQICGQPFSTEEVKIDFLQYKINKFPWNIELKH